MIEYCDDAVDNDGDGLIDCEDGECLDFAGCMGLDYGGPYDLTEHDCADGQDNDGDHAADCEDSDCYRDDACLQNIYGMPF